ncbi:MAG: type II secretion system F family protein [Candidatus Sericytochromatia bacterium]|nr:type II secretion system F family protein [Candidatus Sericytochromatia bacterium]
MDMVPWWGAAGGALVAVLAGSWRDPGERGVRHLEATASSVRLTMRRSRRTWVGGSRRRASIAAALPDMLDLTASAVGSGMGLDAAWAAMLEGPPPAPVHPLHEEMALVLAEVRLGRSREDALRAMADRTCLPDVARLAAALIQAERHGIALQGVLSGQAATIRTARRQRARRQAQEAPVKLLFPLVFGMFPALLVVTLGPPALRLWETFNRPAGS